MHRLTRYFFLLLFFLPAVLPAQRTKEQRKAHRDSLVTFWNKQDTNYVRKYPDRFIVTLSQSYRQYDIRYFQTFGQDTAGWGAPQMIADANASTGISIDFDKISFSFGIKTTPATDDAIHKKGNTKYTSYGLSLGAYRFRFEASYRNYHSFYDYKTGVYDTSFQHTGVYFQNGSMDVRSLRVKTLFIFNKRHFSYNSAYYNTQRQMKTSGSWLIVSNIYDYQFDSDTSLIPVKSRPFFGQYGDLNYFRVQGISIGPGYSCNLVLFRTLYFNATLTSGFDFQHRTYDTYSDAYRDKFWKVGAAGDARFALGLNGKRMFTSVTFRMDYNSYVSQNLRIEPRFKSVDFNIGYRFPFKERGWVKRMKSNKWYQML